MDRAIGNTVRFVGVPLEDAIAMASTIPARWLGDATAGTVTADWDEKRSELSVVGVTE